MNTPEVRAQHTFQLAECGMGPDLSPVVSGRSDSQVLGVTQGQHVTRKRGVMVHLLLQLCPYLTHNEHSLIEHPVFLISSPMSASKSCSPQIIIVVLLERHYIKKGDTTSSLTHKAFTSLRQPSLSLLPLHYFVHITSNRRRMGTSQGWGSNIEGVPLQ